MRLFNYVFGNECYLVYLVPELFIHAFSIYKWGNKLSHIEGKIK